MIDSVSNIISDKFLLIFNKFNVIFYFNPVNLLREYFRINEIYSGEQNVNLLSIKIL